MPPAPALELPTPMRSRPVHLAIMLVSALACAGGPAVQSGSGLARGGTRPPCLPDNGGITLPRGFCATIVADSLPRPRHLVVAPNGDVFVALLGAGPGGAAGGFVGLRDTNGDGRADVQERFGDAPSSEVALVGEQLFVGAPTSVLRYSIRRGALGPHGPP